MTKTIDPTLKAHMAQEVTTLATLWKLTRRDGTVLAFTDHDVNISYLGVVYESASGYLPSALTLAANLSVDNLEATAFLESAKITEADLMAGLYDYATLDVWVVNYADLTQLHMIMAGGWIFGEVQISDNKFSVEIRSKSQKLQENIVEIYSPDCRADLGDVRCNIPIDPSTWEISHDYLHGEYTRASTYDARYYVVTASGVSATSEPGWSTVIGTTTLDGTVAWNCHLAWTLRGSITSASTDAKRLFIDSSRTEVDDYYKYGVVTFLTGSNAGYSKEVKKWDLGATQFTLFEAMPNDMSTDDTYEVIVGCDHNIDTCITKFANVLNFRGEPFVPGIDEAVKVGPTNST